MTWHTTPPPSGIDIEFETDAGKRLTGQVSFVAKHEVGGKTVRQYQLRSGGERVFVVKRWRRVGA